MSKRASVTARLGGAIALALALSLAPAVSASAVDPGPPPADSYISPAHAWADPTHPNDLGRLFFEVEIHFTPPETHWVSHASAPAFVVGVTHCHITKVAEYGLSFGCEGIGTPIPGEYLLPIDVKSEGGDNYGWVVPVTVCPLTGCSDLFTLALSSAGTDGAAAWNVCVGDSLEDQGEVNFDFNLPWNPSGIAFGPISGASGDWVLKSEKPSDGGAFIIKGAITSPGDFVQPVIITDEFGGEHEADLPIHVSSCAAVAALAATGVDVAGPAGWMLALILLGALTVAAAHRRSRRL